MPILELRGVAKHFGAIHALNDVNLTLEAGEVLGLMGDNGAGKSTLVKVIAGNFPPTHGDILLEGERVHFSKPVEAREKGVEVVYQDLALCNNLSAAANVFLGRELKKRFGPFRWLDHAEMARIRHNPGEDSPDLIRLALQKLQEIAIVIAQHASQSGARIVSRRPIDQRRQRDWTKIDCSGAEISDAVHWVWALSERI